MESKAAMGWALETQSFSPTYGVTLNETPPEKPLNATVPVILNHWK